MYKKFPDKWTKFPWKHTTISEENNERKSEKQNNCMQFFVRPRFSTYPSHIIGGPSGPTTS